ncbi:ATP-dependent endonuclease [Acinetobacter baumannii]|uniref:ATP-dependent nuclease n=1 Tax=Acinetobacter baumannii TaxID=470 RepID=UPI00112E4EF8|nr:ATP-dependent endonuclease [Acinetobacter baumannii]TPS61832.1 ATP-dependent endonuclease [Acinetobacter baumannii]
MHISSIKVKNFRAIKDAELKLDPNQKQDLTLIVGKNNSGKTSFIMVFDKFFKKEDNFNFHDFSTHLREKIYKIESETIEEAIIGLFLEISYSKDDNLEYLSEFIIDLNSKNNTVKLYFECLIDEERLRNDLINIDKKHKKKFIEKNITSYLIKNLYIYEKDEDIENNKQKLIKKEVSAINSLINYQVIHAKRNLASSETKEKSSLPLSKLSTEYFNKENMFSEKDFIKINNAILEMDENLNNLYDTHFEGFFENVRDFLGSTALKVLSNLESRQIMSNSSKVVQIDSEENFLPESLNGLGNLNILYLLLQIDLKKRFFIQEDRSINLLFIEEPEAHTHPQMQYIFSKKIKKIIENIPNLQTFISTHSSHIVSQCNFEDIRYFHNHNGNVTIKNFYLELEEKYKLQTELFKFLKQYITLYSAELFFAEKVIFIEGVSEKILLPYFIKNFDEKNKGKHDYIPISSQNITYIEAGANAKAFQHLLNFFEVKSLIITDIDSVEPVEKDGKINYEACEVKNGVSSSNATINHYLNYNENDPDWFNLLKKRGIKITDKNINLFYQTEENGYHARSFEDSFISVNYELIKKHKKDIFGLKNKYKINDNPENFYDLTDSIIKSKSEFASSLLFLALVNGDKEGDEKIEWKTPKYIYEALEWINQ